MQTLVLGGSLNYEQMRARTHTHTHFVPHLQLLGAGVALQRGQLGSLHFKHTDDRAGLNPHLVLVVLSVWLEAIKQLRNTQLPNTYRATAVVANSNKTM